MISLALKALKANPLKTILIYFSLIFSITAIFLISSISNGIINMYSSILKNDGDIIVTQKDISDTFFSNVDIKLLSKINTIKNIESSSALIVGASPIEKLPIVAVYGVSKNRFLNYKLSEGNYPIDKEVLVGESIYKQLSNKQFINIANKDYKISGVFKSDIGFENGGVVLNIKDAGKIFNKSASMIMINTKVDTNIDLILKQINSFSEEIEAKSTQSFVDNYNQFKIIQSSSNAISFIAFTMGLLGIVSIMSITINQRKSEFGIKRAIGIPMKKIVFQIITESFILGVLSFLSSLLLSQIVLYFIKNSTLLQGYVNGEITSILALYIFITSILMAMIGSIIPALNAAKTDPIILIQGNRI
ncbi:ABC transporter permease [Poseidonibacter ostreae]|uniref:FtsX-like permease family protein n=1 Tax=Poseidonibacter ostreae TaxID=2654171 RepID=A0ABQ6VTE7_9BACT|nr:ABC transporter permease [Poseidonibacter ostreae]KAB7884514.1 FtsX-like permease family protein [Poseidonibacter ostreae]KAB7892908.1 FtsX-like permease family protein [Poseidonibacter ostreae]MAC82756.1 ABC transporter permease [Arcobacter sp.]